MSAQETSVRDAGFFPSVWKNRGYADPNRSLIGISLQRVLAPMDFSLLRLIHDVWILDT